MTSVRDLVHAIATTAPPRPRLTWYGPDAERVELSGRVLLNTVVKATNLLVDVADLGPRSTILLDLPLHWRTIVWALAGWTAGAEVVVPRGSSAGRSDARTGADVVVSDRPARADTNAVTGPAVVIGVALPALAMRFPGALPPGAIDGAADLMTYPDALGWVPAIEPDAPALSGVAREPVDHRDLMPWSLATAAADAWPDRPRVLAAGPDLATGLAAALAAWARDGSLVLTADPLTEPGKLATQERVTAVL